MHTAAYALDPSYQAHKLCDAERSEVEETLMKLYPQEHLSILSQLKDFRNQQGAVFTSDSQPGVETIWDIVDSKPSWKWWEDVAKVRKVGVQLTARVAAASCCEFNWSDLDDIIGKKRTNLSTDRITKLVRNRAVHRLKQAVRRNDASATLPTLAEAIDKECQLAQFAVGDVTEAEDDLVSGDEATSAGESSSESDDECESDGGGTPIMPSQCDPGNYEAEQ